MKNKKNIKPTSDSAVGLKNWLYFCDPMGDAKEELKNIVRELDELNIKHPKIKITEKAPWDIEFDVLLFDWGGMSLGNSMLEHFCEHFIDQAKEKPSKIFIMTSSFTKLAMEDALAFMDRENEKPWNIFLTIKDAAKYLQAKI